MTEIEPEAPAIDMAALETLAELAALDPNPNAMDALIRSFLASAEQLRQALHASLARGDAVGARRAVHSLKSSAAMFGAHRVAHLCEKLEGQAQRAGRGQPALDASDLSALEDALERAVSVLRSASSGRP